MKKISFIVMFFLLFFFFNIALSYAPSIQEILLLQKINSTIDILAKTGGKERLVPLFASIEEKRSRAHYDNSVFVLEYAMQKIQTLLQKNYNVSLKRTKTRTKQNKHKKENIYIQNVNRNGSDSTKNYVGHQKISNNIRQFYEKYKDKITNNTPISHLCTRYYDKIDNIAKQYNFPTSLIIATRYREHSCIFNNPDNGRGNFQITSAYYKPGNITRKEFEQQVVDFIKFSRKKRERYETLRLFDKIPVHLDYKHIDLLSLQKHAILYNGLKQGSTPQNNIYANENFDRKKSGRDGIVASVLKAIGWTLEQENKQNDQ